MRLIIEKNAAQVAEYAAKCVRRKILDLAPTADRYFVLGLPKGE